MAGKMCTLKGGGLTAGRSDNVVFRGCFAVSVSIA